MSSSKRDIVKKTDIVFFIIFIYFFSCLAITTYLVFKYSFPDIKSIEPIDYIPDLDSFQKNRKTGDEFSYGKKYHVTFNDFGSRNLFEVNNRKNNIVLLGDSYFFGVGLDDNQTISYFLNEIDKNHTYINLALVNANINDSVEYYLKKWVKMSPPKAIIIQILWPNDICASSVIEEKAIKTIKDDSNYLPIPFRQTFARKVLLPYYLSRMHGEIYQDLTEERFQKYLLNPISELVKTGNKLIIITFDFEYRNKNYETKLMEYCRRNKVYFYRAEDILEEKYLNSRISRQDRHPNSEYNKALAAKVKQILEREVFGN